MGKWSFTYTFLFWIFLNVMIMITMDLALFMQTTFKTGEASIYKKLLVSEFWATIEWLFVIPSQRIGITFLNPAQLDMSSYVFDFLGQILSNKFWLKLPTTIDDYCGMFLILLGMYFSKYRTFG